MATAKHLPSRYLTNTRIHSSLSDSPLERSRFYTACLARSPLESSPAPRLVRFPSRYHLGTGYRYARRAIGPALSSSRHAYRSQAFTLHRSGDICCRCLGSQCRRWNALALAWLFLPPRRCRRHKATHDECWRFGNTQRSCSRMHGADRARYRQRFRSASKDGALTIHINPGMHD